MDLPLTIIVIFAIVTPAVALLGMLAIFLGRGLKAEYRSKEGDEAKLNIKKVTTFAPVPR